MNPAATADARQPRRVAVVGAGWAGLAAAVDASRRGHQVTLFESGRTPGGRARNLPPDPPDDRQFRLDNGQHILAGAYAQTLRLMRDVGVDPAAVLTRMPLTLRFPDGTGLALPDWPAPLDAGWGILSVRGWSWAERASLLRAALRWRRQGFACDPTWTVGRLCADLPERVMRELVEPLCVSALNTPVRIASAQVFLTVMRDALFTPGADGGAGSNLLIPRTDLGSVLPTAAVGWLEARGCLLRMGQRVTSITAVGPGSDGWRIGGEPFDAAILACSSSEAARLVRQAAPANTAWLQAAESLVYEAITTVYVRGRHALPLPMLSLRSGPGAPAQFAFDRGQLGGPPGLLAFVVSASQGDVATLQAQVLAQADALGWDGLVPVRTVTEKRATFSCSAGLRRPGPSIAPGLLAAGDYIEGPYPATLEGAVRSGLAAAASLS